MNFERKDTEKDVFHRFGRIVNEDIENNKIDLQKQTLAK